jgi:hypothetical protein
MNVTQLVNKNEYKTQWEMQLDICQNRGSNIRTCPYQEPAVSWITRIQNPVIALRPALLQSIANQFCENCTIVILQTMIVQPIESQNSLINIQTICILKSRREKCKYVLLVLVSISFLIYYQSSRIMERLS